MLEVIAMGFVVLASIVTIVDSAFTARAVRKVTDA